MSTLNPNNNIGPTISDEKRSWPIFWAFHTPLDVPLTLQYYFSIRGVENLLIYLWIFKDLSWTQNWEIGLFFSCSGVVLFAGLIVLSLYWRCYDEAWHFTASFFWLFANTWWMSGELQDWNYPTLPKVYDDRKHDCSHIMEFALAWILFYFVILKPFRIFERLGCSSQTNNLKHKEFFYDVGVQPRFPCFSTWRQYEQIHILFWLGKDYAWNTGDVALWYICSICTLLIALDFMWESVQQEAMGIEFTHYLSTFIWIIGNMLWAIGELFYPERDYPWSLFATSTEAYVTCRWYSAWILVTAMIPLILLFIIWVVATKEGSIKPRHRGVAVPPSSEAGGTLAATPSPLWTPV